MDVNGQTYVGINPIKVKFNDITNATRLYVSLQYDNLSSLAQFGYCLTDDNTQILLSDTIGITGDDYINWGGDNNFPFTFVANNIGLTIIES